MHKITWLLPSPLVTKIRSFQMTGVAPPRPGIGTFQATFLVSLHSVGSPLSLLTPVLSGPRHCGQLSPRATVALTSKATTPTMLNRFTSRSLVRTLELFRDRIIARPGLEGKFYGVNANKGLAATGNLQIVGGRFLDDHRDAQSVADGKVRAGRCRAEEAIDGMRRGSRPECRTKVRRCQYLDVARILPRVREPEQHKPAAEIREKNLLEELRRRAAARSLHGKREMPAARAANLL